MEKIALIIKEIENKQKEIIAGKTHLIINEIMLLLNNIKKSVNMNEASKYFDSLANIQYLLAKALFKDGLDLGDALWKFTKDFDRIDDISTRIYLFNKIKNREYELN